MELKATKQKPKKRNLVEGDGRIIVCMCGRDIVWEGYSVGGIKCGRDKVWEG